MMGFSIEEIQKTIPHRYPFLMIDRILECSDSHAISKKNITINEHYFVGHFPGSPIVPGVLLSESILQTAAFIGKSLGKSEEKRQQNETDKGSKIMCVSMNVKFIEEVIPGDTLLIEVKFIKSLGTLAKVSGLIRVDKKVVMNGDFTLKKMDRS